MNILILNFILNTPEKGRIRRFQTNRDCMIYGMARGLSRAGHSVTVGAAEQYMPLDQQSDLCEPFKIVYFPLRLTRLCNPALLPVPKGLGSYLRRNSDCYDLVITSEAFSAVSLCAVRGFRGPVVIWQELACYQRAFGGWPARIWYNAVARTLMRRSVAVGRSEAARHFIKRFLPHVADRYVDHGCDESVFLPTASEDGHGDYFIIVSQIIARKRPLRILEAFARYAATGLSRQTRLEVVGDGELLPDMRRRADELGIADRVTFRGRLGHDELVPLLRRAIAMLVDTVNDLNMVSVAESMACGTPVLSNTVPYTASFIAREGTGIARDGWDAAELAEMRERYREFHNACLRVRPQLTSAGCGQALVDIALAQSHKKP